MLYKDTPYKVVKYLAKLSSVKVLPIEFAKENYIRYLIDRKAIEEKGKKLGTTKKFYDSCCEEIIDTFNQCSSFMEKFSFDYLENHYSIGEIETLIKIETEREKIIESDIALTNILAIYFGSSKYKTTNSNLAKAIKTILGIDIFPEEIKDQQFTSILYPKEKTRFIILCENINRLIIKRHQFIEFWYAGGKNIKQLEFIPAPQYPIFYLCDWDFDGLNTYIEIKHKYLPTLTVFIPTNTESLLIEQEKVKKHRSIWKNNNAFQYLNDKEKIIAENLFNTKSIIEEQKIMLTIENLLQNGIN
jgi:hypothetical protein